MTCTQTLDALVIFPGGRKAGTSANEKPRAVVATSREIRWDIF